MAFRLQEEFPHDDSLHFVHYCPEKQVHVGLYSVMFGTRIRAGFSRSYTYALDYCAGDNQAMAALIYGAVLHILKGQQKPDFSVFPRQMIKPMQNDPQCLKTLLSLCEGPVSVHLPDINVLRHFDTQLAWRNIRAKR